MLNVDLFYLKKDRKTCQMPKLLLPMWCLLRSLFRLWWWYWKVQVSKNNSLNNSLDACEAATIWLCDNISLLYFNSVLYPRLHFLHLVHCKEELASFSSPAGMSPTKLSLGGKKLNCYRPGKVWSVTSRLGTGKRPTLFYSVAFHRS